MLPAQVSFLEARVANAEGEEIAEKGPVNRALADVGKAARTLLDWAMTQASTPHQSVVSRDRSERLLVMPQEDAGVSISHIFGGLDVRHTAHPLPQLEYQGDL